MIGLTKQVSQEAGFPETQLTVSSPTSAVENNTGTFPTPTVISSHMTTDAFFI